MKKKKQLTASLSKENTIQQDSSTLIFKAISKMNLEALVAYIDEDINIDDTPCKYTLLAEMKEWFNIFKSKGDTYLNQSEGKCIFILCSQGATTKIFTGNNSGHQYSLKYTLKDNDIIELMQCNYSEGYHIKAKLK
jgi:hypothetical protein